MQADAVELPLVQQPTAEGEGTTSGIEVEPTGTGGPRR
jgi:hypothetical protein